MAALKIFLALFISLTLCGAITAEEENPEERGLLTNGGLLKQEEKPENATAVGGFFNRKPCNCKDNSCRCCLRTFFPMPPLLRQRACMNLTYANEDEGLNMIIVYNRRTLFNNTVRSEGRNPIPICVSPPLFPRAEICAQLTDVYVKRQNMHACLKVEGHLSNRTLFGRTMGCMYVGPNGFAVVRPDADGTVPGLDGEDTSEEDDMDSVEDGNGSNVTESVVADTEPTPTEAAPSADTNETGNNVGVEEANIAIF